jgi:hypothetical protein
MYFEIRIKLRIHYNNFAILQSLMTLNGHYFVKTRMVGYILALEEQLSNFIFQQFLKTNLLSAYLRKSKAAVNNRTTREKFSFLSF